MNIKNLFYCFLKNIGKYRWLMRIFTIKVTGGIDLTTFIIQFAANLVDTNFLFAA